MSNTICTTLVAMATLLGKTLHRSHRSNITYSGLLQRTVKAPDVWGGYQTVLVHIFICFMLSVWYIKHHHCADLVHINLFIYLFVFFYTVLGQYILQTSYHTNSIIFGVYAQWSYAFYTRLCTKSYAKKVTHFILAVTRLCFFL